MDDIKVTGLPDGSAIVEIDGETVRYSAQEIADMTPDASGGEQEHGQARKMA